MALQNAVVDLHQRGIIARLGVKVIPSEDLKTRRIACRLNLDNGLKKGGENSLAKITFGGAEVGRTPYLFNAIESLSQLSYSPNSQLYQNIS